jgi:mRNA-degrading endonuclease toxin of MazEF toxin-antitoxin module
LKDIEQYSLWWVNLEQSGVGHEQHGRRPFFVISNSQYNKKSKTPIGFIASTSENKAKNKFTLPLDDGGHINISQIRTLSSDRFDKLVNDEIYSSVAISAIAKFINIIMFDGEADEIKIISSVIKHKDDDDIIRLMNKFNNK